MNKSKNNKMSLWGIGLHYVAISLTITMLTFLYFNNIKLFQIGIINNLFIKKCFSFLSILLVLVAILLWSYAVFPSKEIKYKIDHGELATEGAYSISRNPLYLSHFILQLGIQMRTYNLFAFIVTFILYKFLEILVKNTEEKWCLEKFGKQYEEYCKNVNRIFPWFPKN